MRSLRGLVGIFSIACMIVGSACAPPDGVQAVRDAQAAFGKLDHFTVSWTTTTRLGSFVDTNEFDCTAMYFHAHATRDFVLARAVHHAGQDDHVFLRRHHRDFAHRLVPGKVCASVGRMKQDVGPSGGRATVVN